MNENEPTYDLDYFYKLGLDTIKTLEVPSGVLASSEQEIYGCIFGRDSLITSIKLMKAYEFDPNPYYLYLTRKILEGLINLLGSDTNIESGEEPGKCIHEFRAAKHEHLTKENVNPWYLYPDGTMRNFDSVDSTPLLLVSMYKYLQKSNDKNFIEQNINKINLSIDWLLKLGDKNDDGFIDYQKHPERKHGGLEVQSWMDSRELTIHEDENPANLPLAPVEAQAYAFLALTLWGRYFENKDEKKSKLLFDRAASLKQKFNEQFVLGSDHPIFAHAIDNLGKPLISTRSSIGHILWASYEDADGKVNTILDDSFVPALVARLLEPDIFEPQAGIRTLSKQSRLFDPISYHNGGIWPHDNSLIAEGMENFGYKKEAHDVRHALFTAYSHFQTPLELFVFHDGNYLEWKNETGQVACQLQAWSAAAMLADALALKWSK